MWILSTIDRLFFPLVLYALYLTVGKTEFIFHVFHHFITTFRIFCGFGKKKNNKNFTGPWAVGEVIENRIGVVFAWGMFIGNVYLPGSFTYAYGFFQLFSFHLPLMMILAHQAERRYVIIKKEFVAKREDFYQLLFFVSE